MDYVAGRTAAELGGVPESVRDAVRRALGILHGRGLVHGDIRLPNVIIQGGDDDEPKDDEAMGARTRIVDFDWAGDEGTVRYPLYLSKVINWPAGVADYAFILADDDDEMVRMLG